MNQYPHEVIFYYNLDYNGHFPSSLQVKGKQRLKQFCNGAKKAWFIDIARVVDLHLAGALVTVVLLVAVQSLDALVANVHPALHGVTGVAVKHDAVLVDVLVVITVTDVHGEGDVDVVLDDAELLLLYRVEVVDALGVVNPVLVLLS